MRSFDGSVEIQLTLRNVTDRALIVADLRSGGVILARCKVHIVMTGTTRGSCGRRQIPGCLRCSGGLLMTRFASPYVGWIGDGGPIRHGALIAYDPVRSSGLYAGQL